MDDLDRNNMVERIAMVLFHKLPGLDADYDEAARAVLEAMKIPTPKMVEAGKKADWVGDAEGRAGLSILPDTIPDWGTDEEGAEITRMGIWAAMIDAALTPTQGED